MAAVMEEKTASQLAHEMLDANASSGDQVHAMRKELQADIGRMASETHKPVDLSLSPEAIAHERLRLEMTKASLDHARHLVQQLTERETEVRAFESHRDQAKLQAAYAKKMQAVRGAAEKLGEAQTMADQARDALNEAHQRATEGGYDWQRCDGKVLNQINSALETRTYMWQSQYPKLVAPDARLLGVGHGDIQQVPFR